MTRLARRAGAALALALTVGVVGAPPAAADPAGPTDYETEILGLDPAVEGVVASVVGGDSFLRLTVAPGTEVLVIGYRGEPFVRFLASGAVEENRRSPSWYLSQDRFADAAVPAEATPDAPPEWVQVADDGAWAWHDHRSHWMGTAPPPGAEPGDVVLEAVVPLEVDGRAVSLSVRSTMRSPPSVVPAVAGLLLGVMGVVVARRRDRVTGPALVVAVTAVAALVLSLVAVGSVPPETGPSRLPWVLAVAALVPALGGILAAVRGRAGLLPGALVALAAAELTLWGWTRRDGLRRAILPTDAPAALDRFVTAAALGAGVAALVTVLAVLLRPPVPAPVPTPAP